MPINPQLRARLGAITLDRNVESHAAALEALRVEIPHSIRVLKSDVPLGRYTCAVHAFHLVEDPGYLQVAGFGFGRTFASPEFVEFLMREGRLQAREAEEATDGDLVVYLQEGRVRHVGRLAAGRVVSKWGIGVLCDHEVWDVPEDYGDEVRYFVGPGPVESWNLFTVYAESRGFRRGR